MDRYIHSFLYEAAEIARQLEEKYYWKWLRKGSSYKGYLKQMAKGCSAYKEVGATMQWRAVCIDNLGMPQNLSKYFVSVFSKDNADHSVLFKIKWIIAFSIWKFPLQLWKENSKILMNSNLETKIRSPSWNSETPDMKNKPCSQNPKLTQFCFNEFLCLCPLMWLSFWLN